MTSFVDRDAKCHIVHLDDVTKYHCDFFTVLQAACNFVLIMTSLGGDEDGDYIITRGK